ncbi:MAG: N-acetylmuramoyl-L-alanine amidase [Methylovirgula sp.]
MTSSAMAAGARAERGLVGARSLALQLASPKLKAESESAAGVQVPAVATAVHLEDAGDRAKLSFDLTGPVKVNAFVLAAPDRVVIDLPEVDFHIAPQAGGMTPAPVGRHRSFRRRARKAAFSGLVSSFRFGLFAPGRSRVVINLAGPAKIQSATVQSAAAGKAAVLVIEIAKTSRATFQIAARMAVLAAAADAEKADPAAAPSATDTGSALPVVVVDPGHGGVDSGAMVNGLVEKNIVLAFSKELAEKLRATHHYKVVMTRDSDVFIPLGGRVRIARDAHASLFVSIHADTIADAASVSGATVYTNSDRASDAEAARTAEKENQSDATAGLQEGKAAPSRRVSDILFDLTKRETRTYSHVFARTLVNYWRVAARLNKNPERAAGFIVLTAPDVPSILLELGYLSNVKDARSLVAPKWRDETTSRVVAAINAFFKTRGEPGTPAAPTETARTTSTLDAAAAASIAGAGTK